jgi:1,4-alpha-glucan branching enzyme
VGAVCVDDSAVNGINVYGVVLYQTAHPGKMLNFMGCEVAQLREWDERREQDWFLRDYPAHDSFFRFCCELNKVYRETPALWELDYDEKGFSLLEADDTENVTYAFLRNAEDGSCVVCALNLSGESAKCELSVPGATSAEVLLHSDWERFGGDTPDDEDGLVVKAGMVALELPACSAVLASLTRTDKKA